MGMDFSFVSGEAPLERKQPANSRCMCLPALRHITPCSLTHELSVHWITGRRVVSSVVHGFSCLCRLMTICEAHLDSCSAVAASRQQTHQRAQALRDLRQLEG